MHEAAFAQAVLPAPTVCLGLLLKPYSLGHELFLIREENNIALGGDPTIEDLQNAVLFCCQSFKECRRMAFDPLIRFKLWIWRRRLKKLKPDLLAELKIFLEYRKNGTLFFPDSGVTKTSAGPSPRKPGSPFLLRLHNFLMIRFRLTEEQAWDYPLGLAIMRWSAYWEQEGGCEVYNETDAKIDAAVAALEAKEKAEKEGGVK